MTEMEIEMEDDLLSDLDMGDDLMSELEDMFSSDESEFKLKEKTILTQDLEGFASCFPDWDLHPQR